MTAHIIPPPWLQAAVGHAERLGRDFLLRPLADREARTLAAWQEQGVRPLTAGAWLSLPTARQRLARPFSGPCGVFPPPRGAA